MAKGASFERKISKALSLWWTENTRDDIFWRSQTSGARATIRKKQGKQTANQEGDITCSDPIGQGLIDLVSIECKKGYDGTIDDLLGSRQSEPILIKFFKQCERETEGTEKGSWLIWCQDRRKTLIFFDYTFYLHLRKKGQTLNDIDYVKIKLEQFIYYCCEFEEFLKKYPSKLLKEK